jgi:hypothetical protein
MDASSRLKNMNELLWDQIEGCLYFYDKEVDILNNSMNKWKADTDKQNKKSMLGNKKFVDLTNEEQEDIILEVNGVMENELSASLILSIYGYFEYSLYKICKNYESILPIHLKVEDIKGSGTMRSIKYLEIVGLKNLQQGNLNKLISWKKVRNYLIHNCGRFNPDMKNDIESIKKVCNIFYEDVLNIYEIQLNFHIVKSFILEIRQYLKYILDLTII